MANVYVDQSMQTGILGHTSFFDRFVSSVTRMPGALRALPSIFLRRIAALYRTRAESLAEEQKHIQELTHDEALMERKRYSKGLALLGSLDINVRASKPAEQELLLSATELVKRLRENVFLMDLIINHELEPGDELADLLEDYYDGLLVEERKNEEHIPWEEAKARIEEIGNRRDVYD